MKARTILMGSGKGSRTINKTIVKGYEDQQQYVDAAAWHNLTEQWRWLGAWSIETSKITMQIIIMYNDMNTLVIQIIMCLEKY